MFAQQLRHIAAAVALACLPLKSAWAQTNEIRFASSAPPNTVWAMQTERLAKMVSDKSSGTLKVNAFINSQLGSEQDTIQQVARGRIDMGGYSITAGALLVPELALLNMPFLFKGQAEQDCVFDNHVTKVATDLLAKKGVVFVGWTHVGETSIIGKKPIVKPDDLKGLKARAQPTKLGPMLWATFGANPNPLPVTEVNAAFQSGLVDVGDAPLTYYMFSGLNKLAPVVSMSKHLDHGGITIINKAAYDKLPPAARKAFDDTAVETPAAMMRREVREFEAKLVAKHKSEGGTIVDFTPEQREAWRQGMTSAWPKMVEAVGGESNIMWKAIQDGIKACAR